jgi:3-oxoacyl-[acyl-carrier protein] reductase
MHDSLKGRRALVCGSTRGIGRASAEHLARRGAAITLLARDAGMLETVAAGLDRTAGQVHHCLTADFSNPQMVRSTVADHIEQHGPIHVLINNTGGPPPGPILEASPEDFDKALTAHLHCNHLLVQLVAPGMKAAGFGRVINIISTSVRAPIPGLGVSNTTRGAVASWAKTLAGELGPFGITVNNILPGFTATDRLASLIDKKAKVAGVSVAEIEEQMKAEIPARRFGEPQELAAAVGFLASPAAGYINGVSLPVDGGRLPVI